MHRENSGAITHAAFIAGNRLGTLCRVNTQNFDCKDTAFPLQIQINPLHNVCKIYLSVILYNTISFLNHCKNLQN